MSDSRNFAEKACRFSQLSHAARSQEEREAFHGIAAGYLSLAKLAAGSERDGADEPQKSARSD